MSCVTISYDETTQQINNINFVLGLFTTDEYTHSSWMIKHNKNDKQIKHTPPFSGKLLWYVNIWTYKGSHESLSCDIKIGSIPFALNLDMLE